MYYFLALSEEMSATDKWPGFVLTKEGEEFVQYNANLFKYDLLYNPLRFESWQRLANIYDEVKFIVVTLVQFENAVKSINSASYGVCKKLMAKFHMKTGGRLDAK